MAKPGGAALRAADRARRRGVARSLPVGDQHAARARGAGTAAARGAAVEGRDLAAGRPAARGLRDLVEAGSLAGEDRLPVPGRLVSAGANRKEAGARTRAGDARDLSGRAASGTRSADRRRGERGIVDGGRPLADRAWRWTAADRGGRWESRARGGSAGGLAQDRHPALHESQAVEPALEGARAPAGGARRGLPADDLRRESRGGGEGPRRFRAEVEASQQGRD